MNFPSLKKANYNNVLRLVKYLRLKSITDMSPRQLAKIVWWLIKPKGRE